MFLDVLLPQRCVVCDRGRVQLCAACAAAFRRIRAPLCERCGAPTAWPVLRCRECAGRRLAFRAARSAVVYDTSVRRLVSAWKERGLRRLAAAAAEITVDVVEAGSAPVTAVPADPERGPVRGHHPAGALAAEVARLWGVPCLALLRRSASRRQRGLRVAERRANVRGVFESDLSPPRVTLVDDVYTSGSTVAAAASALRRAGAREVEVLTFARAVRGYSVV